MTQLPAPDAAAQAASEQLCALIAADIDAAGGWLPFSAYMERALYAPGLGYYAAGSAKLGAGGDFTTAPELTPLFGATLARQVAELLPQTAGTVYEFGAGSGRLAADLLARLAELGSLPERYVIIDLSPDLIDRQQALLAAKAPAWLDRVSWAGELPEKLDGVVIGNEVLDAMPCELVVRGENGAVLRRGVVREGAAFAFADRPADAALAERADACLPALPGYVSEVSPANAAFVSTLGARLARGAVILVDYGFPRAEYYHPQRSRGTLIGHYRHHTVDDPFFLPGLMDLTCHVDFTAVAEAGLSAGLDLIGYLSQAQFLVNAGLADELSRLDSSDAARYAPQAAAAQKLVSPAEMGELFKVVAFGRGVGIDWAGFTQGDRCHTL